MSKALYIAEKPSVAQEFAKALKINGQRRDGYLESQDSVVTWCVGHLVTMSYPEKYDIKYKRWSLDTLPFLPREFKYEVIPGVQKQFEIVKGLLNREDVDTIYVCTDSGREGEYIYRLVAQMAGVHGKKEKRVWIDSQTEEEIMRGIREAKDLSAYDNLSASAYLRAKEDYLMGINFSRVLTLRYGNSVSNYLNTKYQAISVGRVMTCVLGMVVRREREIRAFVKTPFYRVLSSIALEGENFEGEWRAVEGSRYFQTPYLYKENGFKEKAYAEKLIQELLVSQPLQCTVEKIERKKENNDGGYGGAISGMGMSDAGNQVAFNKLIDNTSSTDYIAASGYLQYEPIKGLIVKFNASRNMYFSKSRLFTPTYEIGAAKRNTMASLSESRSQTTNDLLELTANYDKTIAEIHNLSLLLGLSQEENKYEDLSASGSDFENNSMSLMGHAKSNYSVGGTKTRSALRSLFGRVNYNYMMRYMIMASFRYDGSSRFAKGNKWGFFPSVSLGWNIANEPFWENLKETVSMFKLRLSYGALGNQNIGLYRYIPTLSYNTHALNYPFDGRETSMGYAITAFPSSNIKWETTVYKNIGVDISLWNNKLELSAEAYIKNTRDMLSSRNISLATGYNSSILVNDGKLRTTGFEMQAIYHGKAGGLKYDLDLNLSHYKSVLKSMANPDYLYEYGALRTYVGGEIGEFWVYQTAGIFQNQAEVDEWNTAHGYKDQNGNWQPLQPVAKPGDIRFIDQNGDGMLDTNDRVKVGSGTPKVSLGFNINLAYKDFDLVANFYGDFGAKRYNYTQYQLERMDHVFNYGKNALNAWTPENPDTDIPRAVSGDPNKNSRTSTRFVENGDYLRLNNLQIGYNLPVKYCKKMGLSNLRIYVGATRLFTITNYKGYDPSTGSSVGQMGYDYAAIPLSRDFMMGLKFGF